MGMCVCVRLSIYLYACLHEIHVVTKNIWIILPCTCTKNYITIWHLSQKLCKFFRLFFFICFFLFYYSLRYVWLYFVFVCLFATTAILLLVVLTREMIEQTNACLYATYEARTKSFFEVLRIDEKWRQFLK